MINTPSCPFCKVKMFDLEEENTWKCPDCDGIWTYSDSPRGSNLAVIWRDEQHYKHSISEAGGGGQNSVKKRKKPTKGKLPYMLE